MGQRRQRPWNVLAMVAVVLAAILAILGIGRIDVSPVQSRDALRLSSASRTLTSLPLGEKPPIGVWSAMRGDQLSTGEERVDRAELEQAPYKVQVGVYSTSTYELDLTVPSYSSNGYVWLRWEEPMQRYVESRGGDISSFFIVLNTLLS
ncbi:MAG: hypothetical protein RLZZ268_138, partial [Cyanobacteriota bacterium]